MRIEIDLGRGDVDYLLQQCLMITSGTHVALKEIGFPFTLLKCVSQQHRFAFYAALTKAKPFWSDNVIERLLSTLEGSEAEARLHLIQRAASELLPGERAMWALDGLDVENVQALIHDLESEGFATYTSDDKIGIERRP